MSCEVIIEERYRWERKEQKESSLFWCGAGSAAEEIAKITSSNSAALGEPVTQALRESTDFGSGVYKDTRFIIAWVDHIRAFPLFYSAQGENFTLSNNARALKAGKVDPDSVTEFVMAGYVTGPHTLYKNIKALQPGEFLVWDKKRKALSLHRYFRYSPDYASAASEDENIARLGQVLDSITHKIIERNKGRTLWVPLSGGLDSRIILCKLHEHGFRDIQTFTYGPKYNFEALRAKKIAAKLGVPWRHIIPDRKALRAAFESPERQDFWRYADGLKAIPCMREFSAIKYLHDRGLEEGVFINGQSGDYISGAHIFDLWFEPEKKNFSDLFRRLVEKHYGLWPALETDKNLDIIKTRVRDLLPVSLLSSDRRDDLACMEETWEYDGRQICYVANGQRVYEFFGYDWELPLWEKDLVEFFETVPLSQKRSQLLYKKYLQHYNYKNLFPQKESYIPRWPAPMLWVLGAAQIAGLCGGQKAKNDFYARLRYFGHYANQYAYFPWKEHVKTSCVSRNVVSLYVREWVRENKMPFNSETLNN